MRLWSLAAVLANEAEHAAAPPQRLATLTDHTESDVNVVRFSPDGDYLASGGDDQAVILYRMFPGRGESSFGSGGEGPNYENWRALRVCRCGPARSPPALMVDVKDRKTALLSLLRSARQSRSALARHAGGTASQ